MIIFKIINRDKKPIINSTGVRHCSYFQGLSHYIFTVLFFGIVEFELVKARGRIAAVYSIFKRLLQI
jgi:hypothetical protein